MANPADGNPRPIRRRRYWWELSVDERAAMRRAEMDNLERRIRAEREAIRLSGREW